MGAVLRHREADTDFQAEIATQADAFQRSLESALHPAELVMRFANAVERHADVVEIALGNLVDVVFVDQRAVRRQADVKTLGLGAFGNVVDIRPQQRFAAGKNEHRHLEALEVVHHRINLLGIQLAGEIGIGRNRIAMLAGQVAAPDQVPDDHRSGRVAFRPEWRRCGDFLHVLGDAKHGRPCSGFGLFKGNAAINALMRVKRQCTGAFDEHRPPCGILAG